MIRFITHFDHHFFCHGMALLESLPPGHLVEVLALDDECERMLGEAKARPCGVYPLHDLESYLRGDGFPIDEVKAKRTRREYAWTLEPCLCRFILDTSLDGDIVVYCDSDLYFFADPTPGILEAMDKGVIALTPHRFPEDQKHRERTVGRFNFGFAAFRACAESRRIVDEWLRLTLSGCDEHTAGHQRYLDSWPERLGPALAEMPRGHNCAPWQKADVSGSPPRIDGEPLISWHFHEFRRGPGRNPVTLGGEAWNRTNYTIPDSTLHSVYKPYEAALAKWI